MNRLMALVSCCLVAASAAVAEDTVLTVAEGDITTNTTALVAETANVDKLIKRGKGTYFADCCIGATDAGDNCKFSEMVVEEGTLVIRCSAMSSGGKYGNCRVNKITIKAGATLRAEKKGSDGDALSQFYRVQPNDIAIEEGGLFDANGGDIKAYLRPLTFSGAGTLRNGIGNYYGQYFENFTGTILNDFNGTSYHTYTFGEGANAENDFDWSHIGRFVISNNFVRTETIRAYFKNADPTHLTTFPLSTAFLVKTNGTGYASYASTYFYNDVTVDDFTASRVRPMLNQAGTRLTINGGRADFTAPVNNNAFNIVDGSTVTINGGRFTGTGYDSEYERNRYYTADVKDGSTAVGKFTLSHVNFRYNGFSSNAGASDFTVNGGNVYGCSFTKRTRLCGGKISWGALYNKSAVAHSNVWDGAKCYGWTSGSLAFTLALDRTDTPIVLAVGKKGGWFESYGCNSPNMEINTVWKSACPEGETDGGMRFFGHGYVFYKAIPEYRGPLEVNAQYVKINDGFSDYDSDHLFGYGNLVLGNTFLQSVKAGVPVRLAGGPGAKLVVKGAPQVIYPDAKSVAANAVNYVIGPKGAAVSSIVREKGGVLFHFHQDSSGFQIGTYSSMKVEGGVEKNAAGLPKVPVLQADKDVFGVTSMNAGFVDYDDEIGYVPYTSSLSAFEGRSTDVVFLDGVQTNLTANTAVGALKLNNSNKFDSRDPADKKANIYLSEGVTLTVGDGTDPALVVMNSSGQNTQACVKGPGTLAFGGSEAVFAVNGYGALLNTTVTGDNDFTFAGVGRYPFVRLCKNQGWTGTVRVNNCALQPETDHALGTAKVVLGSGWGNGGSLDLGISGLTIANDLTIGGDGIQQNVNESSVRGAIHVRTNATLTGSIGFYGSARIGVGSQGKLTIKGELKGDDNLEIVNGVNNSFTVEKTGETAYEVTETALARDTNGRVIIESANNGYTGEVSVVRSTLVLKGDNPGLGWGDVELDAATLRFENTKPIRVRNRIAGAGRIEIATKQSVTFDDLFGQVAGRMTPTVQANKIGKTSDLYTVTISNAKDESKFTLGAAKRVIRINSLKGIGAIENMTADKGKVIVSVADGNVDFDGTLDAGIELYAGVLPDPGLLITVR